MATPAHTLISRADARSQGLKRYFTGRPCKYGHVCQRAVSSHVCIECHNKLIHADKKKHRADFRRWYAKNAERQRLRAREYRAENLEYCRQKASKWKAANRDQNSAHQRNRDAKKRESGGQHTAQDIAEILKAQRGRCAYCREGLKNKYHVDHIIALSKGGSNGRRNLQLLCQPCNQRKHARDPIEFARSLGRLL